jgi:hypothetical protein
VLHADVVVAVRAAVGLAETEVLIAEGEIDDILGAAVRGKRPASLIPKGPSSPR